MSLRHVISRALDENCDQLHPEQARRILSALTDAGFVIVPKEPTREMWAAGGDACVTKVNVSHDKVVGDVWTAMVKAATPSATPNAG